MTRMGRGSVIRVIRVIRGQFISVGGKRGLEGVEAGLEGGFGEDGLRGVGRDFFGEFYPGFAAAVAGVHRQFEVLWKTGDADGEGEKVLLLAPVEALRQQLVAPDVLATQPLDGGKGSQLPPRDDLGAQLQSQRLGRRQVWRDFVVARLGGGEHGLALLVVERWEEEKVRVLDLKAAEPFRDAALAQEEDLLPAPQRIHDDGPFFERRSHAGRLGECVAGVERGAIDTSKERHQESERHQETVYGFDS
jgi:hypothetical protein